MQNKPDFTKELYNIQEAIFKGTNVYDGKPVFDSINIDTAIEDALMAAYDRGIEDAAKACEEECSCGKNGCIPSAYANRIRNLAKREEI